MIVCAPGGCTTDCCLAPVTTVTTTPMPTCASFHCPSGTKIKPLAKNIGCVAGCTPSTCCNAIVTTLTTTPCRTTTQTTTPVLTCAGFHCQAPQILRPQPGMLVCSAGGCTAQTCCLAPVTTVTTTPAPTFTTTPVPTCAHFACPSGTSIKPLAKHIGCTGGKCTSSLCCNLIITTVTTTPVPTCAGFHCSSPMTLRPQPGMLTCAGGCTSNTCCLAPVTTVTTTPVPTCTS